jgi:hypothetical protein
MKKSYRQYGGGVIGTVGTDYFNSFVDRILTKGPKTGVGMLTGEEAMIFLLAIIAKTNMDNRVSLKRLFRMHSLQNTFGVTFGIDVALPGNSEPTQFDFVRGRHVNVPAQTNPRVPYRPVQTLIIKNLSTTQSIKYSTNPFENNITNTDNTLGPEEQIEIETKVPSIRRLNLSGGANGATVRVILIV